MAKTPGTPKPKAAAPVQFDMNSRERKGGKAGPGGPGRGRDEKRPPARIVNLPPTLVDRGEGWIIRKIGRIDQASHVAMDAEYHLIFEGHEPLVFDHFGAARARSKEAPPEIVPVAEVAEAAADPVEDEASPEPSTSEEATPEASTSEASSSEASTSEVTTSEAAAPEAAADKP